MVSTRKWHAWANKIAGIRQHPRDPLSQVPFYWSLWDSLDSKLLSKGQNGQQYIKEKAVEQSIKGKSYHSFYSRK